jgi:hypothetical protein
MDREIREIREQLNPFGVFGVFRGSKQFAVHATAAQNRLQVKREGPSFAKATEGRQT